VDDPVGNAAEQILAGLAASCPPSTASWTGFDPVKLKTQRELKGLSQTALADLMGLHRVRVSEWERGLFRPSPKAVLIMANTLEISPSELMSINMPTAAPKQLSYVAAIWSA
jgi:DNA-binding transcriptional regulator YiaG